MQNDTSSKTYSSNPNHASGVPVTVRPSIGIILVYGLLVIFWLGLVIFGATAAVRLYEHTHSLVQPLGEVFVCFFALWSLFVATRFPLSTTVDETSIRTVSLRGKRSLFIHDIFELKAALLFPGRGRGIYCLKCRTPNGTTLFLQLGSLSRQQRTLAHRPIVNGLKTSSVHVYPVASSIWKQWYQYPGAPTDDDLFIEPSAQYSAKSQLAIMASLFALPIVIVLLMIMFFPVIRSHQLKSAAPTADQFMGDVAKGDIKDAVALESSSMQADVAERQYMSTLRLSGSATYARLEPVGSRSDGNDTWFVYEDTSTSKTYYVRIGLRAYEGVWRVRFIQGSYEALMP